jgi:hypothetical protein
MDKKPEQNLIQTSQTEPFFGPRFEWKYKVNEKTGKLEFDTLKLSDGSHLDGEKFKAVMKQTTGTSDVLMGEKILKQAALGLSAETFESRMNTASAFLSALNPRDETEALLLAQFVALHESGLKCLGNANTQDMLFQMEKLFSVGTKLLKTASETMQTLCKYRSGGQQTVQVIYVHSEGPALVAQNLTSSPPQGGVARKNQQLNPMDHCGAMHSKK